MAHYKIADTKNRKKLEIIAIALQNVKISKHYIKINMFRIKMFKRRQEWLNAIKIGQNNRETILFLFFF